MEEILILNTWFFNILDSQLPNDITLPNVKKQVLSFFFGGGIGRVVGAYDIDLIDTESNPNIGGAQTRTLNYPYVLLKF